MSIKTICEGIQAVGALATGIVAAYDKPPANPLSTELPALFPFTGPASEASELGADYVLQARIYRVQVAVTPTGQHLPEQREALCRPLIEAVLSTFRSYPTLNGVARVQQSVVLGDTGVAILPEWGGKFIGFQINLEVTTYEPRSYADGE